MASTAIASSRGSKIEVTLPNKQARLLAVACSGAASMLNKVSYPMAEMELRGFGKSRVEVDRFDLASYMSDFDAGIRQTKMKNSVLLGYSHGGYFTTMYALRNPSKVSALVLIEPALFTERAELEHRAVLAEKGDGVGAIKAMLRYVDRETGLDEDRSAAEAKKITDHAQSSVTIAQELRIRAENPISERELGELKMPVLLIGGTESRVADMVIRAASCIPYASVSWVRGAGHLDLLYKPGNAKFHDRIAAVINGFMATLA
ncbi:alpha/beta hydrolase [Bradyrhizobium diazoefficiens]|nr:alpha/beta hydrolase [Bradyrhizobium diazoefficiens]MBR0922205.1 alpha/beta hydrolase [Bradyrhizobium diazoefficiens]